MMGWTSSADPMSNMKLTFDSREAAIEFATKSGWKYEIGSETSKKCVAPGTYKYADNFLPLKISKQVKIDGQKTKIFASPGYGKSNHFMNLTYHGDREVIQHGPLLTTTATSQ